MGCAQAAPSSPSPPRPCLKVFHPLAFSALVSTSLLSGASAQEPGSSGLIRTVTPVTVQSNPFDEGDAENRASQAGDLIPIVEEDLPVIIEDAEVDDSIPLPVPAVYAPSDAEDVLITEASGDPFFLGFAGAKHYPPADEILDPVLIENAALRNTDARPEAVTYGFIMFSKRITEARIAELTELGVRVLGFHPHYSVRAALPVDAVGAVSMLDFVRWVGTPRHEQKLHPALDAELDKSTDSGLALLYMSVFKSDMNSGSTFDEIGRFDIVGGGLQSQSKTGRRTRIWRSNGWMQAALEAAGAEVRSYTPGLHVFKIAVQRDQIESLAMRDFVQFVEPVPAAELISAPAPHDESRAMVASDRVRNSFDGGTNQRAIVGVMDSGLELDHVDLNIAGVGWNCTTGSTAWDDISNGGIGHGTHVTGTILGRGVAKVDQVGNAPGLASWGGTSRLFNYRRVRISSTTPGAQRSPEFRWARSSAPASLMRRSSIRISSGSFQRGTTVPLPARSRSSLPRRTC